MKSVKSVKSARLIAFVIATVIAAVIAAQAQTDQTAVMAESNTSSNKAPIEILRHKIGTEYYPMLDRPGSLAPSTSAEIGDLPPTDNERLARQRNKTMKNSPAPIAPEDNRSRGRLRSYTRVINDAQQVQVVLKNTEDKAIQFVDWDFAFPRYENGQLLSRYDVASKVEIKPGGKKTLTYKLPAGAKKCEVVKVVNSDAQTGQSEKVSTFEAVCGAGFHDPSLLKQKQETITIKRIGYADGTVWQRKE